MLDEIPEIFNEQNLVEIMKQFHVDTQIYNLDYGLTIEDYETLHMDHNTLIPLITDGKILICSPVSTILYQRLNVYNIVKESNGKLHTTLTATIYNLGLNCSNITKCVVIDNNIIYIYDQGRIKIYDGDKTYEHHLNFEYHSMYVLNGRIILQSCKSLISIYECEKEPHTYMSHEPGSKISFHNGNFYQQLYQDTIITINKINVYDRSIIESFTIKSNRCPFTTLYVNSKLIFIVYNDHIDIIKNGNVIFVGGETHSWLTNINIDKYNSKVILTNVKYGRVQYSLVYTISTGNILRYPNNSKFCYFKNYFNSSLLK
jgi:hypothetical protein